MSSNHYLVLLRCGHWYRESRSDDRPPPVQGEFRVCGVIAHYPQRYEAFYLQMQPRIISLWFGEGDYGRITTGGSPDWETPFNRWFAKRYPTGISVVAKHHHAETWKAAIASTLPPPTTGAEPLE